MPVKNGPIGAAEFQVDVQMQHLFGAALLDDDMVQNRGDDGGADSLLAGQLLFQRRADFLKLRRDLSVLCRFRLECTLGTALTVGESTQVGAGSIRIAYDAVLDSSTYSSTREGDTVTITLHNETAVSGLKLTGAVAEGFLGGRR